MAIVKTLIVKGVARFMTDAYMSTIRSGIWNGSTIQVGYGGTGVTSAKGNLYTPVFLSSSGIAACSVEIPHATKAFKINGVTFDVFTNSTGTAPTIFAPTTLAGTGGYILATNAAKTGLEWVAKPAANVTTTAVVAAAADGTTQISSAQSNPFYNLLEGGTVTRSIQFTSSNITISSTTAGVISFTAKSWAGATDSAAGTAGYMPGAASADRLKFLRGDGTWVELIASGSLNPSISNGSTTNTVKITVGGEDSSDYTIPYASNSNKLDNLDSTEFIRIVTINKAVAKNANEYILSNTLYNSNGDLNSVANYTSIGWDNFPTGRPGGGWWLLNIDQNSAYKHQIYSCYLDNHLYIRSLTHNGTNNSDNWWSTWQKVALIADLPSTKNMKINGTNYAIYTSISSLPTFVAPTTLAGTGGYILATNSNKTALEWVAKPTSNVTTSAVVANAANSTTQINANQTDPYYNLIEGGNIARSIQFKHGDNMTIISTKDGVITFSATNTWVANDVDVAGYVAAPTATDNKWHAWITNGSGVPAWRALNPVLAAGTTDTNKITVSVGGVTSSEFAVPNSTKLAGLAVSNFFRQTRDYYELSRDIPKNEWTALFSFESPGGAARAILLNVECHHSSTVTSKTFYIHTSLSGNATIREFYSKDYNTSMLQIRVSSVDNYWRNTRVDIKQTSVDGTFRFRVICLNNGSITPITSNYSNVTALSNTYKLEYICCNIEEATVARAVKWNTKRKLTIGGTGKDVDGTADVTWSLAEILKPTTLYDDTITIPVEEWKDLALVNSLGAGTYAISINSGDLYASGTFALCGNTDNRYDEIVLHVTAKTGSWRPYARIKGNNLQLTTNDSLETSRRYIINILKLI